LPSILALSVFGLRFCVVRLAYAAFFSLTKDAALFAQLLLTFVAKSSLLNSFAPIDLLLSDIEILAFTF
jgi:hypothetical protein